LTTQAQKEVEYKIVNGRGWLLQRQGLVITTAGAGYYKIVNGRGWL
jgi:hypothetical protein